MPELRLNLSARRTALSTGRNQWTRSLRYEFLESRNLLSVSAVGPHFQINTSTVLQGGPSIYENGTTYLPYSGHSPDVSLDAAGNSTVVWAVNPTDPYANIIDRGAYRSYLSDGSPALPTDTRVLQSQLHVSNSIPNQFADPQAVIWGQTQGFVDAPPYTNGHWSSKSSKQSSGYFVSSATDSHGFLPVPLRSSSDQASRREVTFSDVQAAGTGNFVVVWSEDTLFFGSDGINEITGGAIYARRFSQNGMWLDSEPILVSNATSERRYPRIASDPAGNFAVSWIQYNSTTNANQINVQRYGHTGLYLGSTIVAATHWESANRVDAHIASDGQGNLVVVWGDQDAIGGRNLFAQRLSAAGQLVGDVIAVHSTSIAGDDYDVTMSPTGEFGVVWTPFTLSTTSNAVHMRMFTAAGVPDGDEIQLEQTANEVVHLDPAVAMDGDGGLFAVWSEQIFLHPSGDPNRLYLATVNTLGQRFVSNSPLQVSALRSGSDLTALLPQQQLRAPVTQLSVAFSRIASTTGGMAGVNSVTNSANWRLTRNGMDVNGEITEVAWGFNPNNSRYEATLDLANALGDGLYTLTALDAIQDRYGRSLDGDGDGIVGGDYSLSFSIDPPVAVGGVSLLNTTTAGNQFSANSGMDAEGNYVVAWASLGPDDQLNIMAQRYDSSGVRQGSEFQVNTASGGGRLAVDMNSAGDFVVAWDNDYPAGGSPDIFAQRFNRFGDRVGPEVAVTQDAGGQISPQVSIDEAGNCVIVWDDRTALEIMARRYDAQSQPLGSAFLVSTSVQSWQAGPDVATDDVGNFVVVWMSSGQDGSGWGVYGQRYDSSGIAVGAESHVPSRSVGNQVAPQIAMDSSGDFVVTWASDGQDPGESGGVYAQRFRRGGQPEGVEFRVNTFTAGTQDGPSIGMDDVGNFVIAWNSYGQDADSSVGVYAQRFSPGGVRHGDEFQVPGYVTGEQYTNSVAMSQNGQIMISWQGDGSPGDGSDVYMQRYAPLSTFNLSPVVDPNGVDPGNYSTVWTWAPINIVDASTSLSGATIVDPDNASLDSLTVTLSESGGTYIGGNLLTVNTAGTSITAAPFNGTSLMLSGTDTLAHYQQVLRTIQYTNTLGGPGAGVTETVTFLAIDTSGGVGTATSTIVIHLATQVTETRGDGEPRPIAPGEVLLRNSLEYLDVSFTQGMSTAGGNTGAHSVDNPANWQLLRNGVAINGLEIFSSYSDTGYVAYLHQANGDPLPVGHYTLSALSSIQDVNGNALDGNGDGVPGGSYSLSFIIDVPIAAGLPDRQNTTIAGNQGSAISAMDAQGNYVVSWASWGLDDQFNIMSQRYNSFGVRQGGEFQVNTTSGGGRQAVDMNSAGDFVVVWDNDYPGGGSPNIFAQRFDRFGNRVGPEVTVTQDAGGQIAPQVAMDAAGNFVVVWDDRTASEAMARRYNSLSQPLGSEFLVSTSVQGWQANPDVAADDAGNFIVVWMTSGQDGSGWGVYGQRYDADGATVGAEFPIAQTTASNQVGPRIAMDSTGNFVVTWFSDLQDPDGSRGVYARRFDTFGSNGDEFSVNTHVPGVQDGMVVAMDADGDFVIAWTSYGQDPDGSAGVYAQRFSPTGAPQGSEFRVPDDTTGDQYSTSVAISPNGHLLIAWQGQGPGGDGSDVYVQRYVPSLELSTVSSRKLFYNQSAFDGSSAAINGNDDNAIAPDKTAYLPNGSLATFANVSSYTRGINGIMIDLAGVGNHASINANDFVFKVGNNNAPSSWSTLSATPTISVRSGAGTSGSDRVTITWASGSIRNTWLEVQVLPTAHTGLAVTDVFFWGSKVGDNGAGTPPATFLSSAADKTSVTGNLATGVGLLNVRDYNRDNNVTGADATTALNNFGSIVRLNVGSSGPFAVASGESRGTTSSGDSGIASGLAAISPPKPVSENVAAWHPQWRADDARGPLVADVADFALKQSETSRGFRRLTIAADHVDDAIAIDDDVLDSLVAALLTAG